MTAGPLTGLTVVVTRAQSQASVLSERLEALGAGTVSVAMIEIDTPSDGGAALRTAIAELDRYHQIVIASPNGARALAAAIAGRPPGSLPPVACVGPSTAAKLDGTPLVVNVVPDRAVAEGLIEAMPQPGAGRDRLLLLQAEVARDVLETGLTRLGWNVDRVSAYRTVDATVTDADRRAAATGDVITFTSSSTVERFVRLVGRDALPPVVACIGPITAQTARELDIPVDVEADPHTIDGLIDALVRWARARPPRF